MINNGKNESLPNEKKRGRTRYVTAEKGEGGGGGKPNGRNNGHFFANRFVMDAATNIS